MKGRNIETKPKKVRKKIEIITCQRENRFLFISLSCEHFDFSPFRRESSLRTRFALNADMLSFSNNFICM